ncbi:MAG: NAD-dependent epimerase/dehydratase family protein [Desulfobulbaceae bacterium]|nr:NAD-dependent epimerase/dehydratase family protein [Desulfobulbaceae bacterium]
MGQPRHVGILGATSLVGACLLPLLTGAGWQVTAFSRRPVAQDGRAVLWQQLPASGGVPPLVPLSEGSLPLWICVAPIWVLPEYFGLLDAHRARRVVVLSSTSRFTKDDSTDPEEQAIARRLTDAEARVQAWAESRGVEWVILRPTLIYGLGLDKNIVEMVRIIRRLGFFPLLGRANGLRQPIHAEDVARACLSALQAPSAANQAYNISGSETIPYREMVARVFTALGRRPCLLTVPLWAFRLAVAVLRNLSGHRQWSAAMAERMNRDLVFDHTQANLDLGFKPKAFELTAKDLPS